MHCNGVIDDNDKPLNKFVRIKPVNPVQIIENKYAIINWYAVVDFFIVFFLSDCT